MKVRLKDCVDCVCLTTLMYAEDGIDFWILLVVGSNVGVGVKRTSSDLSVS